MKIRYRALLILAMLARVLATAELHAQSALQAKLIDAAKKEGHLVWYPEVALNIDQYAKEFREIFGN